MRSGKERECQYHFFYDYSLIAGIDAIIISYGTLCIYLDKDDREAFASKYRSVPLVILEEYDEDSPDSFIFTCTENYSMGELTEKADECLYEAKKLRRENIIKQ